MAERPKPGRPLGVALAIIASVFLFSFLPLTQVFFVLLLRQRVYFAPDGMVGGGTDVLGGSETRLLLQTALGLIYLVIAVFAWRGRPPYMRYVVILFVLGLMALTLVLNILPNLNAGVCTQLPCDSSDVFDQDLSRIQLPFIILVPLYVIWYMNRGPARAFYRGYYLADSSESKELSDISTETSEA